MGWVLITGATSGIGYELAKIFVAKGHSIIVVGRNEDKLRLLKEGLTEKKRVLTLCIDLSRAESALQVYQEIKKRKLTIDILINNAGIGCVGEFVETDEKRLVEMLHLNVMTLTELTKYIGLEMKEQGKGTILNVASTGAYHPGPYTAAYYATKAYVLSLSEALREELKPYGIKVCSLCPGATATSFAQSAGKKESGLAMSAQFVAEKAYKGVIKGKRVIIPGIGSRLLVLIPKRIAIKIIKKYQKTLSN